MAARTLILIGLVLVVLGLVWLAFPRALSWFGHLPGDIRLERGSTRVFIPVGSMLALSLLFSLLLNAVLWLARKFGS